jgi:galactokinase
MSQRPISRPVFQNAYRHFNRLLFEVSSFFFDVTASVQAPVFAVSRAPQLAGGHGFPALLSSVPMTFRILEAALRDSKLIPPAWRGRRKEALRLLEVLAARFPGSAGRGVSFGFVPGRIEVFGRHTDYAGGRSLVCAIDRGFLYAAVQGRGKRVRMYEESSEFEPVDFDLSPSLKPKIGHWANYPMTMARRLARNFGAGALEGADIVFSSTMPVGSGMSGSSALMMMTFAALAVSNRLGGNPLFGANLLDPVDLAVYLACAENGHGFRDLKGDRGVGTFGGSEDHAAILTSRSGMLSLFGFCPAALQDEVAWPRGWRMAVAFSGVRAEKTREALDQYNLASRRAREAVERYNKAFGTRFTTLREVADGGALRRGHAWLDILDVPPDPRAPCLADRARQFILEDRRHIPGALEALAARDIGEFGKLLTASHLGSRKYLWNIAPEIDFLRKSAVALGAAGASGFGAGFGGSIFAVVPASGAGAFLSAWKERYARRYPRRAGQADFFLTAPSSGLEVWDGDSPERLVDVLFDGTAGRVARARRS